MPSKLTRNLARRSRRALIALAATALAGLALGAIGAGARTVYDYEYSGDYIDGSSTGKPFDDRVGDVDYDPVDEVLYVVNASLTGTGWISKLSPTGEPVNFTALNSPLLSPVGPDPQLQQAQLTIDRTGGAHDGELYVVGGNISSGRIRGYTPGGEPLTGFNYPEQSNCAIAVNDSDEFDDIIIASRNGVSRLDRTGLETRYDFGTSPGWEPGQMKRWSGGGRPCFFEINGKNELFAIKSGVSAALGNNFAIKMDLFNTEIHEINQFNNNVGLAVNPADDSVAFLRSNGTFELYDSEGRPLGANFGVADPENSYLGLQAAQGSGISFDPASGDIWVANRRNYGGSYRVERFERTNAHVIPDTTALEATFHAADGNAVTLHGVLNPDGVATTKCRFEFGPTQALGSSVPCAEGDVFAGSSDVEVSAIAPMAKGQPYWYRLVAENINNQPAKSNPVKVFPQGKPKIQSVSIDRVNTDAARMNVTFDANGGNATFRFEYGEPGSFDRSTAESGTFGFRTIAVSTNVGEDSYDPGPFAETRVAKDLEPGTEYEARVVVTNEAGQVVSAPIRFRTYTADSGVDPCPNAQARQQTEASLLADCRAYELVSAANAGGFDVVSDVVPGQTPLTAAPRAADSLLYSLHFGVIPGIAGSPTNNGRDPYVARRGPNGWETAYAGLPSDGMASDASFSSQLLGRDQSLSTFAFGGNDLCSPCFPDGSTNIPVRKGGGAPYKGMAGSMSPAADPAGEVRVPVSADGSTLVFGSTEKFEPAGNGGLLTIYARDLGAGTTEVVSTDTGGATMTDDVAALDLSDDGARVLFGRVVGTDAGGNTTYDLFLHRRGIAASVAVADTPSGVVFNGMTGDASKVYFSTTDGLEGDTDGSVDLYRADISGSSVEIERVSAGVGSGNTDACAPESNWNVASGGPNCDVVAFAGGAGVARGSGAAYFLSPELLAGAGSGTEGAPNLYTSDGGAPEFVATIEPDHPAIDRGLEEAAVHSYADFQVTPNGAYAAFATTMPLEETFSNDGYSEIYRYDAAAGDLSCASCAPTGATPRSGTFLTSTGLNLTDDGRVFFTASESLTLRDTNERRDAYQWSEGGGVQLVSTGIGPSDSSLVTVSADGVNAFFFTRDTLSPFDKNGATVKVYVARAGGGMFYDPPRPPCAAADECRGPGSAQPIPPVISSVTGSGQPSAVLTAPQKPRRKACKRNQVRKGGKCVKRKKRARAKSKAKRKKRASKRQGRGRG